MECVMKSLIIIFGALLLTINIGLIFDAIDDAITEEYTQTFAGVTTGAGEYAANVTLSRDIHNDDSVSVTSLSSNETADTPSVSSFNTVSRALEVSGLDANDTRTLSVNYKIDSTVIPAGASAFITLERWFWIFALIGTAGGAIYAFFVT